MTVHEDNGPLWLLLICVMFLGWVAVIEVEAVVMCYSLDDRATLSAFQSRLESLEGWESIEQDVEEVRRGPFSWYVLSGGTVFRTNLHTEERVIEILKTERRKRKPPD